MLQRLNLNETRPWSVWRACSNYTTQQNPISHTDPTRRCRQIKQVTDFNVYGMENLLKIRYESYASNARREGEWCGIITRKRHHQQCVQGKWTGSCCYWLGCVILSDVLFFFFLRSEKLSSDRGSALCCSSILTTPQLTNSHTFRILQTPYSGQIWRSCQILALASTTTDQDRTPTSQGSPLNITNVKSYSNPKGIRSVVHSHKYNWMSSLHFTHAHWDVGSRSAAPNSRTTA